MSPNTEPSWVRTLLIWISLSLWFALSTGVIEGAIQISANQYLSHGHLRNAMDMLHDATFENLPIGLLLGFLGGVFTQLLLRFEKDILSDANRKRDLLRVGTFFAGLCFASAYFFWGRKLGFLISSMGLLISGGTSGFALLSDSDYQRSKHLLKLGLPWLFGLAIGGSAYSAGVYLSDQNGLGHSSSASYLAWVWTGLVAFVALLATKVLVQAIPKQEKLHKGIQGLMALPVVFVGLVELGHMSVPPQLSVTRPVNIVVIDVDTFRADRTSLDGPNGQDITPRLKELASRGVNYQRAISQSPWTMPANASMFTGAYPHQHGAITFHSYLSPQFTTLSELLREAGYQTGGVVSHHFVGHEVGFSQGFDHYDDEIFSNKDDSHHQVSSVRMTDSAIEWLNGRDTTKPFLLFAHYFDPHYEYKNHSDFSQADDYDGWLTRTHHDIALLRGSRQLLTPEDVDYLRALYDEEVAFTDQHIGRLLDYLDAEGLRNNTLIVLVADHGEEFMERGWLGHTLTLNDEVIRVPMVLVDPQADGAGTTVTTPVETRAIFATLLDRVGLETADLDLPDVEPLPTTNQPDAEAYSIVWLPDSIYSDKTLKMVSLRNNAHTYMWDLTRELDFLYLQSDRLERENRVDEFQAEGVDYRMRLEKWLEEGGLTDVPTQSMDAATIEQLKALGYL